ncbi:MAG TPA: type III secretion system ATPase SctN [Thermoanaerobaculia bacterium]|nr:type III secretion system ATPase SctN [Thermoanaerobaculia bacterium]
MSSDAATRPLLDLTPYLDLLEDATTVEVRGRVTEVTGLLIRAKVPGVRIGELCYIRAPLRDRPVRAEVVGFRDQQVYLMALGDVEGIGPDSEVSPTGSVMTVPVGEGLLGRVLDGLGEPIDRKGPITPQAAVGYPVYAPPPDPMQRKRILQPFQVGVRAIDGVLTFGEGQRVGIFAAAGGGKSTLLGMLARNTEAEINVISLVGERGREVLDFIEESLGEEGLARSVLVVATSDQPSLVRLKSAYVATAIAEYFRDQGRKVLLMMDSVTRFARAQREVGLAIGEPPARAGFPPSVFATLPRLLERTGNSDRGSITAVYTVLVEGDDMTEPVADEVRSILDGHVILTRTLASRGHYPAIDVLKSASRVMNAIVGKPHLKSATRLRELLAAYEKNRDLILIGAYQRGSDPVVDEAVERMGELEGFLKQELDERPGFDETVDRLQALTGDGGGE